MPLFKSSSEKGDDEFEKAYQKGVNLGRQNWPDASQHFSEASKHYSEAGDDAKSKQANALSLLFSALQSAQSPDSWSRCADAFGQLNGAQVNVGFPASSSDIQKESLLLASETSILSQTTSQNKAASLRDLAQKYLDLVGSDLVLWKLLNQVVDPQKRAYYFLGVASLVEANSVIYDDPKKGATLLSTAVAQLDLAGGEDFMKVIPSALEERDNAVKISKCWFCGREVQGMSFHFFALKADITGYIRGLYGSETPAAIIDQSVMACGPCYTSVKYVSDQIAEMYFDRAAEQIEAANQKIAQLENRVRSLETRFR